VTTPKYATDYRRWFKVKEDILDDPKLDACSADCFRFYIRLLAMLKRANSRDGSITLSRQSLNACAGREQHRHSLRIASEGAAAELYTLSEDGAHTLITVPKWLELQEITPDSRVEQSRAEKRRVNKNIPAPPSEAAVSCSEELISKISTSQPNRKLPPSAPEKFAEVYDQAIRLDSRAPPEIIAQLEWLFGPNRDREFSFVVWSAKAHRKKFDDIADAMRKSAAKFDPDAAAKAKADKARAVLDHRQAEEAAERKRDTDLARSPGNVKAVQELIAARKRGDGLRRVGG